MISADKLAGNHNLTPVLRHWKLTEATVIIDMQETLVYDVNATDCLYSGV